RRAAGGDEVDLRGLVPDDVPRPEVAHDHKHPERVGHREDRPSEEGADVVGRRRQAAQTHTHLTEVAAHPLHPDPGEEEGRPDVHAVLEGAVMRGEGLHPSYPLGGGAHARCTATTGCGWGPRPPSGTARQSPTIRAWTSVPTAGG